MKHALFDSSKVLGVNIAALALTFTGVIEAFKYLGILLGVGYTIWKWTTDWLDRRERRKHGTL